jgi:hypothetical protein
MLFASGPALAETDGERIKRLKEEAKAIRDAADARFAAEEPLCYERFLVNRCIRQAKDARLEQIRRARELEAEAHRLDLAERQRRAVELGTQPNAAPLTPSAPTPDPLPVETDPAVEAQREERDAAAARRQAEAAAARAEKDAERDARRAEAEAEAAQRAEKAARDRARYDEKIREREAERR